jgi:hypothetical protein
MKQTKIISALRNVFGTVILGSMVSACGGGDGGPSVTEVVSEPQMVVPNYGKLSAANIILARGIPGKNGMIKIQASDLPSNVQVLASQVTVVNDSNGLQSADLQTALDTELAVDIVTNIVGVWNVKNYTAYSVFNHPETVVGQVEFKADGTYTVLSGGFAVAGKVAEGTPGWSTTHVYGSSNKLCASSHHAITYEVVDGAVFFRAEERGDGLTSVAKNTKDAITLVGSGGCQINGQHMSRLTRVGSTTAVKAQPATTNNTFRPKA